MTNLNSKQFDEIIASKATALIDIYGDWCSPCKTLEPILEELSTEKTNVAFYKVDADSNPDLMAKLGVRSIPTLLYLQNGEIKDKTVGILSKTIISQKLDNFLV